jgi:hypothetical protein
VVLCHNGVIGNYRSIKADAVVDSECLPVLVEKRNMRPANGSCAVAFFEKDKLFIYRHSQRLNAFTFNFTPADSLTLFASTRNIIPQALFTVPFVQHEFPEGVCFEVTPTGLVEAWRNPEEKFDAERFVRGGQGQVQCAPCLDDDEVPSADYRGG